MNVLRKNLLVFAAAAGMTLVVTAAIALSTDSTADAQASSTTLGHQMPASPAGINRNDPAAVEPQAQA